MSPAEKILGVLFAVALLFFAGYAKGKADAHQATEAQRAQTQETVIEHHDQAAESGQAAEKKSVKRAARTEAVFQGLQGGVIEYARNHAGAGAECSLDDDGLRLWRAANEDTDVDGAGDGQGAVPGDAAAAKERHDGGPAGEPSGGGEGVSPLQGPAPRLGGMAGGD